MLLNFLFCHCSENDCNVYEKLSVCVFRFIEWIGCCCAGAKAVDVNVKKENGGQLTFTTLCRDSQIQHPIRTKACEALAHFPLSISLYSGYVSILDICTSFSCIAVLFQATYYKRHEHRLT